MNETDKSSDASHPQLEKLRAEFDLLLQRMQRPGAREAMQAAFEATPQQLGRAAVATAWKERIDRSGC